MKVIVKDRYADFKDFFDDFYNVDKLAPERISDQACGWTSSRQPQQPQQP